MKDDLKKFLEELSTNEELMTRLNSLNEKYADRIENMENLIILAKEYGFEFTTSDFEETINPQNNYELIDEELEEVAGGGCWKKDEKWASDCFCFLGGGGTGDRFQRTCACVAAGCGELTDYGKILAARGEFRYVGCASAPVAMACAAVGVGLGQ